LKSEGLILSGRLRPDKMTSHHRAALTRGKTPIRHIRPTVPREASLALCFPLAAERCLDAASPTRIAIARRTRHRSPCGSMRTWAGSRVAAHNEATALRQWTLVVDNRRACLERPVARGGSK
jgi:hypothetical protein